MERDDPWLGQARLEHISQLGETKPIQHLLDRLEAARLLIDERLTLGQDAYDFLERECNTTSRVRATISRPYEIFEYGGEEQQSRLLRLDWSDKFAFFIAVTDGRQSEVAVGNLLLGLDPEAIHPGGNSDGQPFYRVETDGSILEINESDFPRALAEFEKAVNAVGLTRRAELGLSDDEAKLLEVSVDELEMRTKTTNALRRNGIRTIGELAYGNSEESLMRIPNFGQIALEDVRIALTRRGMQLLSKEELAQRKAAVTQ
jgi:hypothetical protein